MSSISNRLKNARENKGVSQIQVYKDTGIHNKTLSGYERGISEPDLETLKKLARYYEVSLNILLEGDSDIRNPYNKNDTDEVDEFLLDLKKKAKERGLEFDENSVDDLLDLYEFIKKKKEK